LACERLQCRLRGRERRDLRRSFPENDELAVLDRIDYDNSGAYVDALWVVARADEGEIANFEDAPSESLGFRSFVLPGSVVNGLVWSDARRDPVAFIAWLVHAHPSLLPMLAGHVADNDELLPHVFFGDVTRFAADLARRAPTCAEADVELDRLLLDLNDALLGVLVDDDVDNLIWVSFVENAQSVPGDAEEALRERLRRHSNLARVLSHYE
jgi:hypothetical protein